MRRFRKISLSEDSKELRVAEIVWPHDKELPNPIFKPNGFTRCYDVSFKGLTVVESGEHLSSNCANFVDWMRYYGKDYCDDLVSLRKNENKWRGVARKFGLRNEMFQNPLFFDRSGSELMREKSPVWGKGYDYCHFNFPKDCFYVCYSVNFFEKQGVGSKDLYFVLVKDPRHLMNKDSKYMLGIIPLSNLRLHVPDFECSCLFVSSDIPVMYALGIDGPVSKTYCSDHEIFGVARDKFFAAFRSVYGGCFLTDELVKSVPYNRTFIRIRRHANELPLTTEGAGYIYAVDVTCGRVTDVWLKKQHMNAQFCSHMTGKNAFKNPHEAVSRVQEYLREVIRKKVLRRRLQKENDEGREASENFRERWARGLNFQLYKTKDLSDVFTSEY